VLNTTTQKIQKALRTAALCGMIGLAAVGTSHAQAIGDNTADKKFAAKIGAFFPSGKDVRLAADNTNLALEADYRLQVLPASNSVTLATIGYIRGNDDFQMVPITVSQVFRDPNNTARSSYYYGFGLGIYATKLNTPDTSGQTKGLFGGFLVAGIEGRGPLFGEVKYHYISKYDNKFVGGLQTSVGFRF
jgi:hypothetical protein